MCINSLINPYVFCMFHRFHNLIQHCFMHLVHKTCAKTRAKTQACKLKFSLCLCAGACISFAKEPLVRMTWHFWHEYTHLNPFSSWDQVDTAACYSWARESWFLKPARSVRVASCSWNSLVYVSQWSHLPAVQTCHPISFLLDPSVSLDYVSSLVLFLNVRFGDQPVSLPVPLNTVTAELQFFVTRFRFLSCVL